MVTHRLRRQRLVITRGLRIAAGASHRDDKNNGDDMNKTNNKDNKARYIDTYKYTICIRNEYIPSPAGVARVGR